MPTNTPPPPGTPPVMPLGHALVVTLVALVLIVGFALIGLALNLVPVYAGFLLLWYWTSVGQSDLRALAPAVIGACAGIGMSYLLQAGTEAGSMPQIYGALALMIVALFLVIAGRLPLVCNGSTMLYITVFNGSVIQEHEDFRKVALATLLGLVWFGATIALLARLAPKPAAD